MTTTDPRSDVRIVTIRRLLLAVIVLVVLSWGILGSASGSIDQQTAVNSTFEADDDGWTIAGDATSPEYAATGGNPGGHICADDNVAGNAWYFSAPSAFLGDRSAYYNGTLRFDLNQSSTSNQFDNHDVILRNSSTDIVYDFGDASAHPGTNWTGYSIPLSATDDNWTDGSGDPVSEAGFRTLLGNLTQLRIRGEYVSGSDRGCLDNVHLSADETTNVAVTMSDQTVAGEGTIQSIVVDTSFLPDGGFVAIYASPLQQDNLGASIIGVSSYLDAVRHSHVRITLNTSLSRNQVLIAIPHRDTDDDNRFEFDDSTGVDEPYEDRGGELVTDAATITVMTPTPTPTSTPTPTPSPTPSPTLSPTPTPTPGPTATPTPSPTRTPTGGTMPTDTPPRTADADQPGFGVGTALTGLGLGSVLLLCRLRTRDE